MDKHTIIITAVLLCLPTAAQTQTKPNNPGTPTINVTKLAMSGTKLVLSYDINNLSDRDVWICDGLTNASRWIHSEMYLADDDQTLTIRRRLDVPSDREWFRPPFGRYIRLRPSEKRHESLSFIVPVAEDTSVFANERSHRLSEGHACATRLAIEIGFYEGDLPERIMKVLREAEGRRIMDNLRLPGSTFLFEGRVLDFDGLRERMRERDEEVAIPYTYQRFKGEKVAKTSVAGLQIPIHYRPRTLSAGPASIPDLAHCTKIEIRYQPSILDYFFPFESHQRLFNRGEIEYLRSEQTVVVEAQEPIKAFAEQVEKGVPCHGIVREDRMAKINCYRANGRLRSFLLFNDEVVETEGNERLGCRQTLLGPSMITPEMERLEYRVQCSTNLKNLSSRLHLYNIIQAEHTKDWSITSDTIYPPAVQWCDATSWPAFTHYGYDKGDEQPPHKCPSAGEGKNHYAMNPNCKPDSAADMVLLFEAKAGWNQHGGPELFTFDNHDPKGGCVLLNDGTVKFIRTSEELQQLRWR